MSPGEKSRAVVLTQTQTKVGRRPGRPRSEEVEKAILDAALEVVADEGLPALSIEAVAHRAKVAKTTIYRRWGSKGELLVDAVARLKGPIPVPPGDGVRSDLIWLLKRTRDNGRRGLADRIFTKLFADAEVVGEGLVEACRQRTIVPRREVTKSVLERGVAEGMVRDDTNLDLAVDLLTAPGIVARATRPYLHTDEEIASIVDIVLRGLAPID